MKVILTGSAGFIGSHLCEALNNQNIETLGIDSLTDYYDVRLKVANLKASGQNRGNCQFLDLTNRIALHALLDSFAPDYIIHLAGNPGVRNSWGDGFDIYLNRNLLATQCILDWLSTNTHTTLLNASTSSVYGEIPATASEDMEPAPRSPYGLTKLAAEHLVNSYRMQFGIKAVSLRFFSVYGPRQRSDMAFMKLMLATLYQNQFPIYGSGDQERDFTHVNDIVGAIMSLVHAGEDILQHPTYNLASGRTISLNQCIEIISDYAGAKANLKYLPPMPGDVLRTSASIERLSQISSWKPSESVETGLIQQWQWLLSNKHIFDDIIKNPK